MRRYLILIVATGTLVLGCSSTDETSTPSSTTSSSVVISAANKQVCADFVALGDNLKTRNIKLGVPEQTATEIQKYFGDTVPLLENIKKSAPADLAPTIDLYLTRFGAVALLDPTNADDQQKLSALLMAPDDELKNADASMRTWASTNCGVTLPGKASGT